MNSFFTLHSFLEVGKTQDLPSKFWQTLGDALRFWQVNYAKLLETNSFFTWHIFLQVGKTQDLPSKF
jgi:hypothetical protein